jgi:hypothetical protein
LTVQRGATSLTTSGTASGGTATLTATLTSTTGAAVPNATVNFTLDGAFAGSALTDSSGVATLSDVPTTDATGTVTGAVVATFPGTLQNKSSQATGDLVESQSSTTTTAANATATHSASNQNVALSATVTSPGGAVSEGTETFTLMQGTTVIGTAVTVNVSAGAAAATYVLPGGTAAGTYTIQAVYNGTANFATSTDTSHSLTVS